MCYRKTKAIMALIPSFVFVLLHLFEGTDRICEMIENFYDLSQWKAIVLRSGLGAEGRCPHNYQFIAYGLKKQFG